MVHVYAIRRGKCGRAVTAWEAGLSNQQVVNLLSKMPETCGYRAAERGPMPFAQMASVLGLTKQRVQQLGVEILEKARGRAKTYGLELHVPAVEPGMWEELIG